MPVSVDGAVGAASAALLSAAPSGQRSPWSARTMLALGVLATLGANAYSGSAHGIAGIMMSAWPTVVFIGSAETALGMTRRAARETVTETVMQTVTEPVMERSPDAARTRPVRHAKPAKVAALVAANPGISGAELGRKLKVSERTGRRLLASAVPA